MTRNKDRIISWLPIEIDLDMLKGIFWSATGSIFQVLFGMLTVSLIAHATTPEMYGSLMLIIKTLSLATIICLFGFKEFLVKIIADKNARGKRQEAVAIFGICLFTSSFLAIFLGMILQTKLGQRFISMIFNNPDIGDYAVLMTMALLGYIYQSLFYAYFRGFKLFSRAILFNGCLSGFVLFLALSSALLLDYRIEIHSFLVILPIVSGVVLVTAIGLSGSRIGQIVKFRFSMIPGVLSFALAFYILNLLSEYCGTIYSFYLGAVRGTEDVAILVSLEKLAIFISVPLGMLYFGLGPMISENLALGKLDLLAIKLKKMLRLIFAGSLAIYTIYFLFGGWILTVLFGKFYGQFHLFLIIISTGHLISVATGPWGGTLMMAGKQKIFLYLMLINAMFYSLIFFYPVHLQNLEGVILSLLIFPACINIIGCIVCRKTVGIRTDVF